MPVIYFIKVADNLAKLKSICETVHRHFLLKQPILITAPNEEAAQFIDQLLWKMPEESFIPHTLCNASNEDLVVVTTSQANLNKAIAVFNLCPQASPLAGQVDIIYELYDATHPAKEDLSKQRQSAYASQGFPIKADIR